jgi:hypothetical protein
MNINYTIKRAFDKTYVNFFQDNNFNILNAGDYNILDLYYLLYNCKFLILSWGCISYLNKLIITNPNIKTLIISHVEYTHEFKFIPLCSQIQPCKNVKLIYNLKSNLDDNSKIIIQNELNLFENIN